MKLPPPFTITNCRLPIGKQSKASATAVFNRQSEKGMALVITLIMLAVTLVMAVAFLALARRERAAVSTTTDTTTARFAADSALNAAQSQIMVNLLNLNSAKTSSNSLYNFSLIVSTNFINDGGFNPDPTLGNDPVNVNYSYTSDNSPYSAADFIQNIANLQILPRPPVFIVTNTQAGSNDFRFYLDLNRNGTFEDSGLVPNVVRNGQTFSSNGPPVIVVGDPQWIGVLARPDTTHSPNNQFVSRYAFLAMPVGNTLDLNAIYNQSKKLGANIDSFYRNQGVGSWELNLAAFLVDLNTNQWGATTAYNYSQDTGANSSGIAFDDALSLLNYRYSITTPPLSSSGNYANLASANNSLTNVGNYPFRTDGYADGPLQTTLNTNAVYIPDNLNSPWSGADNPNRYVDLSSELFDPNKTAIPFTNRLISAGTNASTYDRYTYYRLLSQLGTDSDPDAGKMNLNYSNVLVSYDNFGVVTNMAVIPGAETNLVPWTATNFFMAAADRMLRLYTTNWFVANPSNYLATYYGVTNLYGYRNINGDIVTNDPTGFGLTNFTFGGVAGDSFLNLTNQIPAFGVTNIPVYVNGQFVYSSAVNRVLQMAANLYDASTTNFYPSVFKPIFENDRFGDVFIVGFRQVLSVTGPADSQLKTPFDASQLSVFTPGAPLISVDYINVYGVPWIIGAKKGFPNFNKFGMQNIVQVTRKLQVQRSTIPTEVNTTKFLTNQLLAFSISNTINAECWNSYTNAYKYPVQIYAQDTVSLRITNDVGAPDRVLYNYLISSNFTVSSWPGYTAANAAISFTNPISGVVSLMTNNDFYFGSSPPGISGFVPDSFNDGWESNKYDFPFPHFGLLTTNRLQLYMLDNSGSGGLYHVIDYVHFAGPQPVLDITAAIETNNPSGLGYGPNMWSQAFYGNGLVGVQSQIRASEQSIATGDLPNGGLYWKGSLNINQAMINGFATFMGLSAPYGALDQSNPAIQGATQYYESNYIVQVPYTPTATISQYISWQANDPLVHYLSSDLNFFGTEANSVQTGVKTTYGQTGDLVATPSYTVLNDRYQPWGAAVPTAYQSLGYNFLNVSNWIYYKDSLIWNSDSWDFSTNVYPAVGWIGRVHRGTPWQTVYLKAHNVLDGSTAGTNTWAVWSGNYNTFDAVNGSPLQDRMLFDLFTTRFNDNAARGTLSVNVGAGSSDPLAGLAAWSALFSSMVTITNTTVMPSFAIPQALVPATPTNNWLIVSPAGIGGMNSVLGNLVVNINSARTNFINADGVKGSFEHAGDILSTVALTEKSPFLNIGNTNQLRYGISDEAYEWLPQQMMGLVRMENTPRYVVYAYGQALRPAPNALVTAGGNNFGLVTNYQVVAESAVRAIVSVQQQVTNSATGPVTNYTTKVESYSVLPPN